jgi:hypothetical protein
MQRTEPSRVVRSNLWLVQAIQLVGPSSTRIRRNTIDVRFLVFRHEKSTARQLQGRSGPTHRSVLLSYKGVRNRNTTPAFTVPGPFARLRFNALTGATAAADREHLQEVRNGIPAEARCRAAEPAVVRILLDCPRPASGIAPARPIGWRRWRPSGRSEGPSGVTPARTVRSPRGLTRYKSTFKRAPDGRHPWVSKCRGIP